MSDVEIVAFDGVPLDGGAGVRTALLRCGDRVVASGRFSVDMVELDRLARSGHVTWLRRSIPALADGVVLYRHVNFSLPDIGSLGWHAEEGFSVVCCDSVSATRWLTRSAKLACSVAEASFREGGVEAARQRARLGLMLVPRLASSETAARLYGILLALDETTHGGGLVREEISVSLDESRGWAARVFARQLKHT